MEIQEERIADALVLHATGRLDGTTAPGFEHTLLTHLDGQPARLVLDLAGIEYVSSAGLRAILLAAKRAKGTGCALAICRLRDAVREVFEMSGFGSVLAMHRTVEEALHA